MRRARMRVMVETYDLDMRDVAVRLRARGHDRTPRSAYDALGDRAEHHALEPGETLATDDDQIRAYLLGQREELFRRVARDPRVNVEVDLPVRVRDAQLVLDG